MKIDFSKINEQSPYTELSEGLTLYGAGTSKAFMTGEWRTNTPIWNVEKCKQCLLCTPTCPDSSIPVVEGKRVQFDYDHCKGCGICSKACPFGAITMKEGIEP